jgi:hypothetical protein
MPDIACPAGQESATEPFSAEYPHCALEAGVAVGLGVGVAVGAGVGVGVGEPLAEGEQRAWIASVFTVPTQGSPKTPLFAPTAQEEKPTHEALTTARVVAALQALAW